MELECSDDDELGPLYEMVSLIRGGVGSALQATGQAVGAVGIPYGACNIAAMVALYPRLLRAGAAGGRAAVTILSV